MTVTVRVPEHAELTHEAVWTGFSQVNAEGKGYFEVRRCDNGLFEMVPASWIVEDGS